MLLDGVEPFEQDGVKITLTEDGIKVSGVLSMRSPSETVTPYFRRVHAAAARAGVERLVVDVAELSFMNSSSIRSLVDWVHWIRQEPKNRQYILRFLSDPMTTWQTTTLAVVRALDEQHVEVQIK